MKKTFELINKEQLKNIKGGIVKLDLKVNEKDISVVKIKTREDEFFDWFEDIDE